MKSFLIRCVLLISLYSTYINAVEDKICATAQDINKAISSNIIERISFEKSILFELSKLNFLGKLNNENSPDIEYINDILNGYYEASIDNIELGDTIQSNIFEAYLKAKIKTVTLHERMKPIFKKVETIDSFIENNMNKDFKSEIETIINKYESRLKSKLEENNEQYQLNLEEIAIKNSLILYDILESSGKSGFQIIVTLSKLDELKKALGIINKSVSFMTSDISKSVSSNGIAYDKIASITNLSQLINEFSQDKLKEVIFSLVSSEEEFSLSEFYNAFKQKDLALINNYVNELNSYIIPILEYAGEDNSILTFADKLYEVKSSIELLNKFNDIKYNFGNKLSQYDIFMINIEIINTYINIGFSSLEAVNGFLKESELKSKISDVLTVTNNTRVILKDFFEIGINFKALIEGHYISDESSIRSLNKAIDELILTSSYNYQYYDEILSKLGEELILTYNTEEKNFISVAESDSSQSCYWIDFDNIYDDILNRKEYSEELVTKSNDKLFVTIPKSATYEYKYINTQTGERIEILPSIGASYLYEFISDAISLNKDIYVWYIDNIAKIEKSLKLNQDDIKNYKFNFNAPSTQFTLARISYTTDDGKIKSAILPQEWEIQYFQEEFSLENTGTNTQECKAYSTDIACAVGIHEASFIKTENIYSLKAIDNYLYTMGLNGLKIYDLSNPLFPKYIGGNRNLRGREEIKVIGDFLYTADSTSGIYIIDISDKKNPILISNYDTRQAYDIEIVDNHMFIADSLEGIKILDISNKSIPTLVSSLDTADAKNLEIKDNYLYLADRTYTSSKGGLRIIDISDVSSPFLKGYYDPPTYANDIKIVDNIAYLSGTNGNIIQIDVSSKSNPQVLTTIETGVSYKDLEYNDGHLFSSSLSNIKIVDITNPYNPDLFNTDDMYSLENIQDISILNKYMYLGTADGIKIVDISNPSDSKLRANIDEDWNMVTALDISGDFVYLASSQDGLQVVDISTPLSPTYIGGTNTNAALDVKIVNGYAYIADFESGLRIIDISDKEDMVTVGGFDTYRAYGVDVVGNYAFVADYSQGLKIIDIADFLNPSLVATFNSSGAQEVKVIDNIAYLSDRFGGLKIIDVSNITEPELIGSVSGIYSYDSEIKGNYLFSAGSGELNIIDITDLSNPILINTIDIDAINFDIEDNFLFVASYSSGVTILDITNPLDMIIVAKIDTFHANGVKVKGDYIYVADEREGLSVINWKDAIKNYSYIQQVYHSPTNITLNSESPNDFDLKKESFTKTWIFSDDISDFDIEIISNNYYGVNESSFIKNGNILSVQLTPNLNETLNSIVLKFTKNSDSVIVSGSETFWSKTKTNNAPRLKDGQLTQIVSKIGQVASLKIETYDADNDTVTLTVEDNAGGNVTLNDNILNVSFSDNQKIHEVKIGLDDGKEKVIKSFICLQFDDNSISNFYSDVDVNHRYFKDIAFATLDGIVVGQNDPNDNTKRIFRPDDKASLAEVLAMVIQVAIKVGKVTLTPSEFYRNVYPYWAMPYYEYALKYDAINDIGNDISSFYPTKEEIAKILVKILKLDENTELFENLDYIFENDDKFTDDKYRKFANITRVYGFLFTKSYEDPSLNLTRAEVANLITKILMIPSAEVSFLNSINLGEEVSITLDNIEAKIIDNSLNLVENQNIESTVFIKNQIIDGMTIDSNILDIGENFIYILLNNNGVRNILQKEIQINFIDLDSDGISDDVDIWIDDSRYSADNNNNGIPDLLDIVYNLHNKNFYDYTIINNKNVSIAQLFEDGGFISKLVSIDLNLDKGWNLISLPIDTLIDIESLNNPNIEIVRSLQNNTWKIWTSNGMVSSEQRLNNIMDGYGYWIKSTDNTILNLTGNQYPDIIDFESNQWNMIGSRTILDINQFLLENPDIKILWTYKNGQYYAVSNDTDIQSDLDAKLIPKIDSIQTQEGLFVK